MGPDRSSELGRNIEVTTSSVTLPIERASERWKSVLKHAAIGFGIGASLPFLGFESGVVITAIHGYMSSQQPLLESILSMTQEIIGPSIIGGLTTGSYIGLLFGRLKYLDIKDHLVNLPISSNAAFLFGSSK